MKLRVLILTALMCGACSFANAQDTATVKVRAKGEDIQLIIATMFEQVGAQYVIAPGIKQPIYINLDSIPLKNALLVLSQVALIKFEKRDGIWYVTKSSVPLETQSASKTASKSHSSGTTKPTTSDPKPKWKPAERVEMGSKPSSSKPNKAATGKADLNLKVNSRLTKTDLRLVFAEYTKQTGVKITVDSGVPRYSIDAFMIDTTLGFALDRICNAANLKYRVKPDNSIYVYKA